MAGPPHLDRRDGAAHGPRCPDCAAPLADDQRYCVECGARVRPLPSLIARLIGTAAATGRGLPPLASPSAAAEPPPAAAAAQAEAEAGGGFFDGLIGDFPMPGPAATAVAVMALLAFGVLVGSAVSPAQPSGASAPIVVAVARPAPAAPPSSSIASTPAPATTVASTPPVQSAAAPTVTVTTPAPSSGATGPAGPVTPALPPINHVFLIALSDQGFNQAFGPASTAPYLAKTLTAQGELIDNYYAVAGSELANGIALISGQGPTAQTSADCPNYTDVSPGTVGQQGQILGDGCVYPRQTLTLADQLTSAGRQWRAYVEDIANGGPGQPTTCRHPALGSADPNQAPSAGDAFVTWRDPFVYFHSLIDIPTTCTASVVGLDQLAADLKTPTATPAFVYVVPNRCHDGSDQPCAPGQPAGLPAADAFLRTVVPEIEASSAYKQGGLIAITFDQAPQTGPNADATGCCSTTPYPNVGTSGSTGTTGSSGSSGSSGSTGASGATGASGSTGASGATGAAGAGTPAGGGRVGLLLISKFVKPGSVNLTDDYNHFSLLRSIEDLFSLTHLGYAGAPGLLGFDKTVYNAFQ